MPVELFLKVVSDCCIALSLLGTCPFLLPYSYPLLLPALVCGVAAGAASYFHSRGWHPLRYLCAAIPYLSLLMANGWREMLVIVPIILYTCAVVIRGELYLEYFTFRHFFKRSLILLGIVFALLSLCLYFEDPTGTKEPFILTDVILRYGLIHAVTGVALQRQLRLGAENRSEGGKGQIVSMLGTTGAVVFGFILAEPALRQSASDLGKTVFIILLSPIMAVEQVLARFIAKLLEDLLKNEEYREGQKQYMDSLGEVSGQTISDVVGEMVKDQPQQETYPVWIIPIVAAGVILALVLMFLAFAKSRGELGQKKIIEVVDAAPRGKTPSRMSNRGRVRMLYREFLRQERKRGARLKKQYTTADILKHISPSTNRDAAAELRDIYISARYDETREVSRSQADAAHAALVKSRKA